MSLCHQGAAELHVGTNPGWAGSRGQLGICKLQLLRRLVLGAPRGDYLSPNFFFFWHINVQFTQDEGSKEEVSSGK